MIGYPEILDKLDSLTIELIKLRCRMKKIVIISLFICLYFSYELYSQVIHYYSPMNDIFTPMGSPVETWMNTVDP